MSKKESYFTSKYFWGGILFLIFQIIVISRNYFSDYIYFFWFCDFAPLVLALAFFLKREHLAKAVINFGLIFQMCYIITYTYHFITGGLYEELIFSPVMNILYFSVTILFHLSTFFAVILTYKTKPTFRTIINSFFVVMIIYFVSLFFTPYDLNINMVNAPWDFVQFTIPYYVYLWPLLVFILIIFPSQGIQYYLYKKSIRKKLK